MKMVLALMLMCGTMTMQMKAQTAAHDAQFEGLWEGYDGEWGHVSRQLVELAEAIPADKYSWRPGAGVRSVSEVLMHITQANFFLLSAVGKPMPKDMQDEALDKKVTSKVEVIADLKRSLDAVKDARAGLKPGDMERRVKIEGKMTTEDGIYLRIIVHANEHMGQLVAYARMNGIVPPWSK